MILLKITSIIGFFLPIGIVIALLIHHIYLEQAPLNPNTVLKLNKCNAYKENRTFSSLIPAKKIPILVYHRIVRRKDFKQGLHIKQGKINPTVVPYANFETQMNYLYTHHYVTLTLNEFYSWIKNGKTIPRKSILLTFDDGYKNNYANVYPVLKKYHFRATIFMITSKLRTINQSYNPKNGQYLSIHDIQSSCDIINYQSHTYNDHYSNKDDISSLITNDPLFVKKDLQTSIKNLAGHHLAFAYPYSQYDNSDLRIINQLFNMAFTAPASKKDEKEVTRSTNLYKIPRYSIFSTTSMKEFIEIVK